jgi:hypothetical protein
MHHNLQDIQPARCTASEKQAVAPSLSKRIAIAGAVIVAGAGLFAGWPWLTAIGAAPFLIAVAPCAAMCAVGLCAMRGRKVGIGTAAAKKDISS